MSMSVYLSVCLSACLSVRLSLCLSVRLSVCLSGSISPKPHAWSSPHNVDWYREGVEIVHSDVQRGIIVTKKICQ